MERLELSLLEVNGPFGFSDIPRSTKDHIKRSFGTLAILQEIGHFFEFGSLDTFQKIRVCFAQALGKGNNFLKCNVTDMFVYIEVEIRLWSLERVFCPNRYLLYSKTHYIDV